MSRWSAVAPLGVGDKSSYVTWNVYIPRNQKFKDILDL